MRDKLQGLTTQQGAVYHLIPSIPSKVTGNKRRTHAGLRRTYQPAHTQIKAWVALVSEGNVMAYGATSGVNHLHNQKILHQGPLSVLEAEYAVVQRVLMMVPAEVHLQIVCFSMQGIKDMYSNLERWNWGGWGVLQRTFELLNCREHQVQLKVAHTV